MDPGPILTEVGTTVAIVVLFVWLLKPFMARLMDNLDRMSQGYVGYVETQVKVATSLNAVCSRLDSAEKRDRDATQSRAEIVTALQELSGVVRGLQQQQQAHEGRAQKRHEQALEHADERHAELVGVLKHLNGKTT